MEESKKPCGHKWAKFEAQDNEEFGLGPFEAKVDRK